MGEVIRLGSLSLPGEGNVQILEQPRARLMEAVLRWKRYRRWTSALHAACCELCRTPFTEGGEPGLNAGYSVIGGGPAGQDDYCWICAICFETWRDHYEWTVLDTRGRATEPQGLLDSIHSIGSRRPETDWDADPDLIRLPAPRT